MYARYLYIVISSSEITVGPAIPRDFYDGIINVRGNGYCGFRVLAKLPKGDEEAFPEIKGKMLAQVQKDHNLYANVCYLEVERLEEILSYGLDPTKKPEEQQASSMPTSADMAFWFNADCIQVAADAFSVPIAVYSDEGYCRVHDGDGSQRVRTREPILYLPYKKPAKTHRPIPLILHHVNGNHWVSVNLKRPKKMSWLVANRFHYDACEQLGIDNGIRNHWRTYLDMQKPSNNEPMFAESVEYDSAQKGKH